MRPVRLELRGFGAFREQTEIDFDGLDLFALVGPTGAGKSTIIDGIAFALYGSVARYKSTNLVAPVINQLSNEARIRLDFTIGKDDYTATRVVRKTAKGASTKEARLERGDNVLAGNARELDAAVEELLGLNFDQFTKTVVLPQGEFARFLTENAEARQALLRRLLAMERFRTMGSRARERARDAASKSAALVEQMGTREPVADHDITAAQQRLDDLDALAVDLRAAVEELDTAAAAVVAAAAAEEQAKAKVSRLKSIKAPTGITKAGQRIAKLEADRTNAREKAEAAAQSLQDARAAVTEFDSIVELERRSELHDESKLLQRELKAAIKTETATAKALAAASSLVESTSRALQDSEVKLESARRLAGAGALADLLEVGEPCPLCQQRVDTIPAHQHEKDLAKAEKGNRQAKAASTSSQKDQREAHRDHDRAELERGHLEERSTEVAADLDGQTNAMETKAQLKEARARAKALEMAETAGTTALEKLRAIEQSLAELDEEMGEVRRAFTSQRDALADLGPPTPSEVSITTDWDDLVSWAKDEATAIAATAKTLTSETKDAAKKHRATEKAIVDLLRSSVGTDSLDVASAEPMTWLAEARGAANAQLASLTAEREAQAGTQTRIDEFDRDASVASELGRLLGATGFERWLMTDVMHTLAERATDRLLELSGGSYSLVTDGADFSIRDHRNADEIRSARTLSGGETFLASLALALALSENVAELATDGAPRIESMFLDEGFGTLDPETLDVVASAIEELGAQGQMIGVITHVGELAERIPTRFDISRTPSGSQATRVDVAG